VRAACAVRTWRHIHLEMCSFSRIMPLRDGHHYRDISPGLHSSKPGRNHPVTAAENRFLQHRHLTAFSELAAFFAQLCLCAITSLRTEVDRSAWQRSKNAVWADAQRCQTSTRCLSQSMHSYVRTEARMKRRKRSIYPSYDAFMLWICMISR
jgi:hypothetical protein